MLLNRLSSQTKWVNLHKLLQTHRMQSRSRILSLPVALLEKERQSKIQLNWEFHMLARISASQLCSCQHNVKTLTQDESQWFQLKKTRTVLWKGSNLGTHDCERNKSQLSQSISWNISLKHQVTLTKKYLRKLILSWTLRDCSSCKTATRNSTQHIDWIELGGIKRRIDSSIYLISQESSSHSVYYSSWLYFFELNRRRWLWLKSSNTLISWEHGKSRRLS